MDIPSARRHGITDADIRHAIGQSIVVEDVGEDPDRWLVIGPDRAANLLEVVVLVTVEGDEVIIKKLAGEAESGYDVDQLIARRTARGRPRLGMAPSTVESVRLDPELKERLVQRARVEGVPVSEVIREALRHHLGAS